jgi:hypothetical protein
VKRDNKPIEAFILQLSHSQMQEPDRCGTCRMGVMNMLK